MKPMEFSHQLQLLIDGYLHVQSTLLGVDPTLTGKKLSVFIRGRANVRRHFMILIPLSGFLDQLGDTGKTCFFLGPWFFWIFLGYKGWERDPLIFFCMAPRIRQIRTELTPQNPGPRNTHIFFVEKIPCKIWSLSPSIFCQNASHVFFFGSSWQTPMYPPLNFLAPQEDHLAEIWIWSWSKGREIIFDFHPILGGIDLDSCINVTCKFEGTFPET